MQCPIRDQVHGPRAVPLQRAAEPIQNQNAGQVHGPRAVPLQRAAGPIQNQNAGQVHGPRAVPLQRAAGPIQNQNAGQVLRAAGPIQNQIVGQIGGLQPVLRPQAAAPFGNHNGAQVPHPERYNLPPPQVADSELRNLPRPRPAATTGNISVWDHGKVFVTFDAEECTLSAAHIRSYFNNFSDSVQSVSIRQDQNGFNFGIITMKEDHRASELLGDLPSVYYKINGRWIKLRRYFNRYPPF